MPEACHSDGNIDSGVKPGIVLISFTKKPSAVKKKSTRANPSQPSDLKARANAEKWMDWTTSTFAGVFRDLFWGTLRTAPADRDEARIAAALVRSGELLAMADESLSRQPYLSGEQFAMGDIPLGAFIYAWFEMPIQRPQLPHLAAWYERLKQRPAYQRGVMTALT